MTTKHTPGPWVIRGFLDGGNETASAWDIASADITAGDHVAHVWEEYDARLIAAAPDLLAALKELRARITIDYSGPRTWVHSWERAIIAIAKAEGKD